MCLTVNRQIIRVVVCRAATKEFLGCGGVRGDRVVTEEAMHVARVLARQYNRVNVLAHHIARVDNGVSLHRTSGGEENERGNKHGEEKYKKNVKIKKQLRKELLVGKANDRKTWRRDRRPFILGGYLA
jgi:hypothetical protein